MPCPDCGETNIASISEIWGEEHPWASYNCYLCGYAANMYSVLTECKRKKKQISSCTCDIKVLMVTGCRCGAFLRERESANG
jgi:hypothetical protein